MPRAAAEHLAEVAGARDEGCGADDDAADWGAETFGKAEGGGVERGEEGGEGGGCGGGDFPDACAVEVQDDVVGLGEGGYGEDFWLGKDGTVEGVFEADDAGGAGVDVGGGVGGGDDGVGGDVGEG